MAQPSARSTNASRPLYRIRIGCAAGRIRGDEISLRNRHRYLTLVLDHGHRQDHPGQADRDTDTLNAFFDTPPDCGANGTEAASTDMEPAHEGRSRECANCGDLLGSVPCGQNRPPTAWRRCAPCSPTTSTRPPPPGRAGPPVLPHRAQPRPRVRQSRPHHPQTPRRYRRRDRARTVRRAPGMPQQQGPTSHPPRLWPPPAEPHLLR